MCRRVECRKCGKPGWAGCGAHIEQVLGDVPRAERCRCHEHEHEEEAKPATGHRSAAPQAGQRSWLSRLLGN